MLLSYPRGPLPRALTVMWLFSSGRDGAFFRGWDGVLHGWAGRGLRSTFSCLLLPYRLQHGLVCLTGCHGQLNHLVELVLEHKRARYPPQEGRGNTGCGVSTYGYWQMQSLIKCLGPWCLSIGNKPRVKLRTFPQCYCVDKGDCFLRGFCFRVNSP